MAFKVVDASSRSPGRQSSLSPELSYYGKTAQFRLNDAAIRLLGEPDRIEVQYDEENRQLGFVASGAAHAVTLRKDNEIGGSRYFGFRSLANLVGLTGEDRFAAPMVWDEERNMGIVTLPAAAEEVADAEEAA